MSSWLSRWRHWLTDEPYKTIADEQPLGIPEPPLRMRDVAGVAHVRLVDIPKKPARRKAKGPVRKKRP